MEYRIKSSFYSPDNQYSGLAGRVIDEELYNKAIEWGYKDRVEIVGYIPACFRTDEELDKEIAELLAEKDRRLNQQSKNNVANDTEKKEEKNNNQEPIKYSRNRKTA